MRVWLTVEVVIIKVANIRSLHKHKMLLSDELEAMAGASGRRALRVGALGMLHKGKFS